MENSTPQDNNKNLSNILSSINKTIFWIILALSIAPKIFTEYYQSHGLVEIFNYLNVIVIALYFSIDILNNYFILPSIENTKMDDLIDNSFGSKFCTQNSIGYFDNDDLKYGHYKAAANLFEKCFFSYSLTKSSLLKKVIWPLIMFFCIVGMAVIGFKYVPFYISILQAFLSSTILGTLIKHLVLLWRLSVIYNSWITLFHNKDIKENINNYIPYIYRYWIQYEKILSKIPPSTSDAYKKNKISLTKEWNEIRTKYNIN